MCGAQRPQPRLERQSLSMKLIRTTTSRLALSWTADTSNPRALHGLLGNVLVAADAAKIADEDVLVDTVGRRTTIFFTTDTVDVPRKPGMAAWNAKSLDEAKTEFLATETVTISYALHGAATAADLLDAIDQIKGEIPSGITVNPRCVLLGRTDDGGSTTMNISVSETVPGIELDTLSASRLAALPQSHTGLDADPIFNPEAGRLVDAPVPVSAEAPKAASKKACKPAQVPVEPVAPAVVVEPAAEPVVKSAPVTEMFVEPEPVAVPEPVSVVETETELVVESVPEPIAVVAPEPVVAVVPESVAVVEAETVEPFEAPAQAAVPTPAKPLTVVPTPARTSDFDAPEPPDFDSYPPEIDAPEPITPDAPDMPEFDVAALREPPAESSGRRQSASNTPASNTPASNTRPARTKTFAPPAIVTGPNGKLVLNEDDIF